MKSHSVVLQSVMLMAVSLLCEGLSVLRNDSTTMASHSSTADPFMEKKAVVTDEQRLYRRLRRNYDPYTRPVFNASHPVIVQIGITLTQIFDLDEKNQVLTTNVWLDLEWEDETMQWDPDDYNGLKILRIPCKHIWKPDIVLYNSVEDYTDGYMQALAMVRHDGNIFWPPIVKFHSTCQIDITFFPFDDQVCTMKLGSWAYDGFQVDVVNRSSGVDLSNYVSNGEWLLLEVASVRKVVKYSCCPEPFPDIRFILYLRRRTLYYTYNVLIPCIMLSTLTLLVFWMSPESGEKVTLGLTVLLAFSVFMLLIAENMPATSSNVPLIGVYLTSVMTLTSVSVILAVVVSNINNRGRKDKSMPTFIKCFIGGLARIVCFRLHYVNVPGTRPRRPYSLRGNPSTFRSRPGVLYKGVVNHVSTDSGCGLVDNETNVDGWTNPTNPGPITATTQSNSPLVLTTPAAAAAAAATATSTSVAAASVRTESRLSGKAEVTSSSSEMQNNIMDGNRVAVASRETEHLVSRLHQVLLREEEREKGENLCREWQEAAEVIDRCLFFIFVVATLAATISSLVILPLTKKPLDANVDIFKH